MATNSYAVAATNWLDTFLHHLYLCMNVITTRLLKMMKLDYIQHMDLNYSEEQLEMVC